MTFAEGLPSPYQVQVGKLARVRCVRGSRCYPTSRFVVSGRLVTDTLTGLVWQQQASTDMTWTAAQSYCSAAGSGFRLSTLKELESIVDLTATSAPTINRTAFPNTPVDWYWTSSPYTAADDGYGYAWYVYFSDGVPSSSSEGSGTTNRVRCVR